MLSEPHSIRQMYVITAGHLLPSFQDWPRTHHRSSSHSDSPRQHSRANFSSFPEKHRALCCLHSPQSLWEEQQSCRPVGGPVPAMAWMPLAHDPRSLGMWTDSATSCPFLDPTWTHNTLTPCLGPSMGHMQPPDLGLRPPPSLCLAPWPRVSRD